MTTQQIISAVAAQRRTNRRNTMLITSGILALATASNLFWLVVL
jgi:hypothetical protein